MKRGAQEIRDLQLKEEAKDKWLYNNAAALFGI
jgi:predicted TIM-barrel fold metal-dependent hydrolase